jgi:hypothetical protein
MFLCSPQFLLAKELLRASFKLVTFFHFKLDHFFHCWKNQQILDICLEVERKAKKPRVSPDQTEKGT